MSVLRSWYGRPRFDEADWVSLCQRALHTPACFNEVRPQVEVVLSIVSQVVFCDCHRSLSTVRPSLDTFLLSKS